MKMQFNQRASVVTLDGKGAGHIDRVVIDPKTKEITHLVIQRGLLQKEDLVVPINAVTSEREGELTLHLQSSELEFLPAFEEEHYVLVDENQSGDTPSTISLSPAYPGVSLGLPATGPKYVAETHLNIPDNTVALKEGAKVIARDNKEVGHVAQILTSTPADQVTHFLVVKGLLVKEHRLIPVRWVDRLADDEVNLAVNSSTVERLPVIEPA
jgi:uncharacterized protein YrrD